MCSDCHPQRCRWCRWSCRLREWRETLQLHREVITYCRMSHQKMPRTRLRRTNSGKYCTLHTNVSTNEHERTYDCRIPAEASACCRMPYTVTILLHPGHVLHAADHASVNTDQPEQRTIARAQLKPVCAVACRTLRRSWSRACGTTGRARYNKIIRNQEG